MKIIKNNKENKERTKLKIRKALLTGVIFLGISTTLTGCRRDPEDVKEIINDADDLKNIAGVIKDGNTLIPFYYDKSNITSIICDYYNLETGEYIGKHVAIAYGSKICSNIKNSANEIIFVSPQIIWFGNVFPNVYLNGEIVANFDADIYQKYEDEYLKTTKFNKIYLNSYELENLKTGEVKYLIGYQITNTQFFNFETFELEEYPGYNVTCVIKGSDLEEEEYSYGTVLDMIEEAKEEENAR